jgi:hypothetical protein
MLHLRVSPLFETVVDLEAEREAIRRRRYGMVEVANGRFQRILLRPFPKRASLSESVIAGRWWHACRRGNRCLLYYNQPRTFPNFLALGYVLSSSQTTLATLRHALAILDEIARIKGVDAILCDATNRRISDRLLARWGWQPHTSQRRHRNFIKRLRP